jgi:hypothetical protein
MFVKFLNNKSITQCTLLPEEENVEDWVVCADELSGNRLIIDGDEIRIMNEEELDSERQELAFNSNCKKLRYERNKLLSESDKLVLPDLWESYTEEKRTAVTVYRQALRDVPLQEGFPEDVIWPELSI